MTEWDADQYARRSGLQKAMADEVLALLKFEGSERVLDVGCGDGKITAEIARRVPRGSVLGVDPSRDMIAFASVHFAGDDRSNLGFEVADARLLPYQAEFDRVVSFNALHWVKDQEAALRSIRAALKSDGSAWLRMVCKGERKSLEDVIEDTRRSERWAEFFGGFQIPYLHLAPERYREIAENCGFRVHEQTMGAKAWDFHTRAEFAAFGAVTFVEWTRCLPEDRRADFVEDVLDRYRSVAADLPGEENTFKFYQMNVALQAC